MRYLAAIILFVISGIFLFIGLFMYNSSNELKEKGIKTEGVIIEMIKQDNVDHITWYPVFGFNTNKGEKIQIQSKVGHTPPRFSNGQIIDIIYDPDNPEKAAIVDDFDLGSIGIIFLGIGVFLDMIGVLVFIIIFRQSQTANNNLKSEKEKNPFLID